MKRGKVNMPPEFIKTDLPGVVVIKPDVFGDHRGFFLETYHSGLYTAGGAGREFVQDNHSHSIKYTLRGLHYQLKHPQAKLIYVVKGEIFDVAVDIRKGSPTFGKWTGSVLSEDNKEQLFVPEGFAHGFCVLSGTADVIYKCSDLYTPDDQYGILWSDPEIGIQWNVKEPLLSDKDSKCLKLSEVPEEYLPVYKN